MIAPRSLQVVLFGCVVVDSSLGFAQEEGSVYDMAGRLAPEAYA
jgi:hypothetical protein